MGWEEILDTPPALEEGLAEVFGDALAQPPEPAPIEDVIEVQPDGMVPFGSDGYMRAGHFVRFLVERYSLADVLALAHSAASNPLDRAFVDVLDESLEDVLADYADYPWCSRNNWRIPVLECSGEPLPWTSDSPRSVSLVFELACGDEKTIGPRRGQLYQTETIDVDTPGSFVFVVDTLFADSDAYTVRLVSCDASCEAPFELEIVNGVFSPAMPVDLVAGRYYIEFSRNAEAADLEPIEVRLEEWVE